METGNPLGHLKYFHVLKDKREEKHIKSMSTPGFKIIVITNYSFLVMFATFFLFLFFAVVSVARSTFKADEWIILCFCY